MFKKGDVVEFCLNDDTKFTVVVTTDEDEQIFAGVVTETDGKAWKSGFYNDHWSTYAFKHKQEVATPHEAFPMLKDGMIVTTRGRGSYLVVGEKLLDHGGYNSLHDYTEEGEVIGASEEFDIVKVYSGASLFSLDLERYIALNSYQLVWQEQKNAKAIAEIEDQMIDLKEQINTLQEKLITLREEK